MSGERVIKCFIGLFDILGYKNIVNREDIMEIFRVHNFLLNETEDSFRHIDGVYTIGRGPGPHDKRITVHSYSDTIVFYSTDISNEPTREVDRVFLETLVACEFLYMAANASKLPLRGAITVGNLIDHKNILVSKEMVEAYEMEKKQDWIGCWINSRCFEHISKDAFIENVEAKSIIEYDIPIKKGIYERGYVYNWARNYVLEECPFLKYMEADLDRDDIKIKYDNTAKFIKYIKDSIVN